MSENNPDITASDIITDVENRILNPNISGSIYLPWVSYGYQKTYQALTEVGQHVKEYLFGTVTTFDLTPGDGDYSISANMPRFGGLIMAQFKYGASGDDFVRGHRVKSVSYLNDRVTSSKTRPDYYILGDTLTISPMPSASEIDQTPQAKIHHLNRPYQITLTTDVIDIPYRFIYPIVNYVQAKALQRLADDYSTSLRIESVFAAELEQIADAVSSEFSEDEEANGISVSSDSPIYRNPMDW